MFDNLTWIEILGAVWLAIGLTLSLVMVRRGHNGFSWLVVGTLFGPLAFVLAIDAARHDEQMEPATVERGYDADVPGVVDVLVGYDGSPESEAAIVAAARQLGDRLGRLTVATVIPYDNVVEAERQARAALKQLAAGGDGDVGRVTEYKVLHGRPSEALRAWASRDGYELIAVGARGAGLSKRLVGSAAEELSRGGDVPVLVVKDQ